VTPFDSSNAVEPRENREGEEALIEDMMNPWAVKKTALSNAPVVR
jgi:hypothetical protein